MITPQETAQYGQVLRVSVVRAILNCRISARARDMSKPMPTAAPPTAAPFRKVRRFMEPPRCVARTLHALGPTTLSSNHICRVHVQPREGECLSATRDH